MNRVKVEVIAARTGFLPSCLRFFSCSSGCRPWWRLCLVAISPRISDRNGEEAVYGRRRTAPRRARLVFLFLFSSRRSGRIGDYLSGGSAAFSFCFVFSSFFLLFLFLPRLPCAFIFLLWFWFFFFKTFFVASGGHRQGERREALFVFSSILVFFGAAHVIDMGFGNLVVHVVLESAAWKWVPLKKKEARVRFYYGVTSWSDCRLAFAVDSTGASGYRFGTSTTIVQTLNWITICSLNCFFTGFYYTLPVFI